MQEERLHPRRWAILVGMTFILVAIQFSVILPGGGAILVMQQYGIEPMMFSMIMTAPYLTGFLFAIPAGAFADRIGLNKVLVAGFVLAAVLAAIMSTMFVAVPSTSSSCSWGGSCPERCRPGR